MTPKSEAISMTMKYVPYVKGNACEPTDSNYAYPKQVIRNAKACATIEIDNMIKDYQRYSESTQLVIGENVYSVADKIVQLELVKKEIGKL